MALEKRQPLPIGRYWLDVRDANHAAFRQWTTSNPKRITVLEEEPGDGVTWFLWKVLQPTRFDQKAFGFPTIAPSNIQHAADTAQRPPPVTSLDVLDSLLGDAKTLALLAIAALILMKGNSK